MKKIAIIGIAICVLLSGVFLYGYFKVNLNFNKKPETKVVKVETKSKEQLVNIQLIYDSEDTAIFLGADLENKQACFQNVATGKRYTLQYSGTTQVYDRFGQQVTFNQLKTGTIAKVRFYKATKNMTYIKEETDVISYRETDKYKIDFNNATMLINDQLFKFNKNLTVMSGDKEITLGDIESTDVISVWGYNDQIYSISIDKGHGYLTFSNDTYFTGGWVEIGEKVIKKINSGMKIVVPEGTYTVSVLNNGSSGNKKFTFEKGETINWDLGEIEIAAPKNGKIVFTITPTTARVYIDGEEKDIALPIELEYGIHQITVIAGGYQTLSKYMKVGAAWANISIDLIKQEGTNEQSRQDETETTKEETQTTEADSKKDNEELSQDTSTYKVHIDKPTGVEVYVDGNYIGIAPVEFTKKSGNIVITLRQSGCQTRSYAIDVDNEAKDTTYSFAELEKNN